MVSVKNVFRFIAISSFIALLFSCSKGGEENGEVVNPVEEELITGSASSRVKSLIYPTAELALYGNRVALKHSAIHKALEEEFPSRLEEYILLNQVLAGIYSILKVSVTDIQEFAVVVDDMEALIQHDFSKAQLCVGLVVAKSLTEGQLLEYGADVAKQLKVNEPALGQFNDAVYIVFPGASFENEVVISVRPDPSGLTTFFIGNILQVKRALEASAEGDHPRMKELEQAADLNRPHFMVSMELGPTIQGGWKALAPSLFGKDFAWEALADIEALGLSVVGADQFSINLMAAFDSPAENSKLLEVLEAQLRPLIEGKFAKTGDSMPAFLNSMKVFGKNNVLGVRVSLNIEDVRWINGTTPSSSYSKAKSQLKSDE